MSRKRIFRMSGSSTSCTFTPHTTPVMSEAFEFSDASEKNSANVAPSLSWRRSVASSKPVSHRMTSSSSACVRPLRSIFER
ncbi:Uncharacterised protein [Mycobacteroides abscessus subsp. abscessus]|nr:Uncharacterised protein [Mycobacteroides abscessus subsp. abscessus]